MIPGQQNIQLEEALEKLPEIVSQCLLNWRKATLDRERIEATLYLVFRGDNPERTATELKALINKSDERYEAVLAEISFESIYNAKNETLLAAKKLASLRTAF